MKLKIYLLSALLGGFALFAWGAITHMGLPWWEDVMRPIPNEQVVVDALKTSGVQNGMYYGMQGMFLVTFFGKGMSDGVGMGSYMAIEFLSDAIVALLLAWVLLRSTVTGVLARARFALMLGILGWVGVNLSYWIWYNFPFAYILLEFVDNGIGMFLGGLVIGWIIEKYRIGVSLESPRARAMA